MASRFPATRRPSTGPTLPATCSIRSTPRCCATSRCRSRAASRGQAGRGAAVQYRRHDRRPRRQHLLTALTLDGLDEVSIRGATRSSASSTTPRWSGPTPCPGARRLALRDLRSPEPCSSTAIMNFDNPAGAELPHLEDSERRDRLYRAVSGSEPGRAARPGLARRAGASFASRLPLCQSIRLSSFGLGLACFRPRKVLGRVLLIACCHRLPRRGKT